MNRYEEFLREMKDRLPLGMCFDIKERELMIGGRDATVYFIDGLTNSEIVQHIFSYLMKIPEKAASAASTMNEFVKYNMPFHSVVLEDDISAVIKNM